MLKIAIFLMAYTFLISFANFFWGFCVGLKRKSLKFSYQPIESKLKTDDKGKVNVSWATDMD